MTATFNADEQAAAAAISDIMSMDFFGKRSRDDGADHAAGVRPFKIARPAAPRGAATKELKPAPYYYYHDHSMDADDDPLTPLTPPGRVPNFPAKMHAILCRQDFADIVAWLPHGRSWRVLKPREFEVKVIPKFFEHAKFSSFVRQANGWGFRRITTGKDRNSYYHEKFLRGLPHLCKTMKRPGVNEKKQADPDHEPDFYKIAEESPVPDKADDDSMLLNSTIQGGPKARVPIYWGSTIAASSVTPTFGVQAPTTTVDVAVAAPLAPETQMVRQPVQLQPVAPVVVEQMQPASPVTSPSSNKLMFQMPSFMAMPSPQGNASAPTIQMPMPFPMPAMDPAAASQFAAGFAAATAFSQQHFSQMLQTMQHAQQAQMQQPQTQPAQQPQMQQVAAQPQAMPQQSQP